MTKELEKGITENGTGFEGVVWNILGQTYYPKAVCETTFAFETNSDPGQFVPVHVHPTQDEFILVQEGELDLKLDGVWSKAKAGDLVREVAGMVGGGGGGRPNMAQAGGRDASKLPAALKAVAGLVEKALG